MDKNFHKEFDQCPVCGSNNRFCEQLGNELKERELASRLWVFRYDVRQGMVQDNSFQSKVLIGSTVPGFIIHTDICMDCGCVYAVSITRIEGEIKATLPPPRPGKNPIKPSMGNPFAS